MVDIGFIADKTRVAASRNMSSSVVALPSREGQCVSLTPLVIICHCALSFSQDFELNDIKAADAK